METAKRELLRDFEYLESIILEAIELTTKLVILETNPVISRELNEIGNKLQIELKQLREETEAKLQQLYE